MVADGGEEIKMMMRSRERLVILLDSQSVNLSGAHYHHQNIKHLNLAL